MEKEAIGFIPPPNNKKEQATRMKARP